MGTELSGGESEEGAREDGVWVSNGRGGRRREGGVLVREDVAAALTLGGS